MLGPLFLGLHSSNSQVLPVHEPDQATRVIRFGVFEVDLHTTELRKQGVRIRLPLQSFQVLEALLRQPGELVTRKELKEKLWPADSFGDFEHGLNAAVNRVREALGDSSDNPRFVETLPRRGYRFLAPVNAAPQSTAAGVLSTVPMGGPNLVSEPDGWLQALGPRVAEDQQERAPEKMTVAETGHEVRNRHARKWLFLVVGSLFVLVAVIAYILSRSGAAHAKGPKITSLAVLPLKNLSGDPEQEYFADGMTEAVIGRLSMIRGLRVISRTSVMQFKDTRLTAPEIAKTLRVDAFVEGSVTREGNRIRVHAQLIRASTDDHFWSEEYDRDLPDVLALQSSVAQAIAEKVEVTVTGEERARLVAARPVSPEAYETYLKGLIATANTRAQVEKRIAYFDEAIRKDPTFAPAYVGLADAYAQLGTVFVGAAPPGETRAKVIGAARKALELDPDLAEAHVALAGEYQGQWHWADAEAEYRRALELNPNDSAAHLGLSDWLLCHGRTEEALAWARRGRELDPLGDAGGGGMFAWTLFNAHRYDEAIHEFRNVQAIRPEDETSLWELGWALIENHQVDEAILDLEKVASVTDRSPGVISALIWAYAHAGRRLDALRLLGELKRRQQTGYVPAAAFVNAYLGLGDNDEALAWLERAYEEQSNLVGYIEVFPLFDPLRGDYRFQDLVRRVGLN